MNRYKLLSVFFCIAVLISVNSCTKKESKHCEKEIYLLPNGFSGIVLIYLNQKTGAPVEYENGARLYRIPKSGIFKSQFRKNGGCMSDNRIRFFYVDSLNKRKEIKYFLNLENSKIPKKEKYVMLTFLPDKKDTTPFMIHLVGEISEFVELTNAVRRMQPEEILKSLNP